MKKVPCLLPVLPVLLLLLLLMLLGLPAPSVLGETTEITVVRGNGSYPPNEIMENGKLSGVHVDLVEAAARTLNVTVHFRSYPWKRALSMVRQGTADAVTYAARTPEREAYAVFLNGNILSRTTFAFFVLSQKAHEIRYLGNLEDLRDFRIGTVLGYTYPDAFNRADFLQKDMGALSDEVLLKKLLHNRFDMAIGDQAIMRYLLHRMKCPEKVTFLKPNFTPIPSYIAFSRAAGREKLAERFARALTALRKAGDVEKIRTRYGLPGQF